MSRIKASSRDEGVALTIHNNIFLMATPCFDPVQTQLHKGINLIEASAGTGKTYAIAMLVLRFVVEQDMKIDELLVVTFTKAATEELKYRVRGQIGGSQKSFGRAHL